MVERSLGNGEIVGGAKDTRSLFVETGDGTTRTSEATEHGIFRRGTCSSTATRTSSRSNSTSVVTVLVPNKVAPVAIPPPKFVSRYLSRLR
jgi:hypothetical protein